MLIIGDSIIKHIDVNRIYPGHTNMKVCLPGARADKVYEKIVELNHKYCYDTVIVHVGSNYIPHKSSNYISRDLITKLEAIQQLLPSTKLHFSEVLPKQTTNFLHGISKLNRFMREECTDRDIGYIHHRRFAKAYDTDRKLICWDGTHLSYSGVAALQESYTYYLTG